MTTDYKHPDYDAMLPKWSKVRDAVAGEDAVKARTTVYLPDPGEPETDRGAADARYEAYRKRAVYYNATGRTLAGLVGVAYANWPAIEISKASDYLLSDADGSGVGLIGQSQRTLADVLQTGRGGLLADATTGSPVKRTRTLAQAQASGRRSLVVAYQAESILTWETNGGKLTRVVLSETHSDYAGGEVNFVPQLRELLLVNGKYVANLWRKHSKEGKFVLVDTFDIGLPFIPFTFVGATNNDEHPDQPPLLDLANLNLAHYRNSADYEESAFLIGQPMLAISGVTEEWVEKRGAILFGSRSALPLPEGGSATLLQAGPNTLAKEAMTDKERMMQALGARLVAQGEAVKTATQSAAETKSAYSVLSLACDNVSAAYSRALTWAQGFDVATATAASFAIDTRFSDLTLDANAIRETVAAWQAGLVPQSDAWTVLRRLGVIDQGKTDAQLAGEIEGQGPALNLDEAGADVSTAAQQLDAAIALHEKHMNGTAPTTGADGDKSQQKMMDQMMAARDALGGSMAA